MSPADHIALKDWEKCTAINIRATGMMIPMIAPLLTAASEKATALFIDDPAARAKFMGAYGASKAAQIALARAWQMESARIGARVLIEEAAAMPTATRARFFPGENRAALTPCHQEAERLMRIIAD